MGVSPFADGSGSIGSAIGAGGGIGGGDGGLPPTIPPPHWLVNASCYTPLLLDNRRFLERDSVSAADAAKASVIAVTMVLTACANVVFLVVLNTRYYRKFLRPQPRCIVSAGAVNDLLQAALVMALGVYPALFECWPLGQGLCQMQALVRGTCSQNASLVLIVLAVERYVATMHPFSYNSVCDTKVCAFVLLLSWSLSACFFGAVVLHPYGFHFNVNGLMICEPYYLSNNALILASCVFYFPTTMALMYCYGTIFHSTKAKTKYRNVIFSTLPCLAGQSAAAGIDKFMVERRRNDLASRSAAAISLTFIIVVTPWAIQQVITSVTRTTAPSFVDFFVSWLAASHSFWTPAIYWMLNPKFRRAVQRFFIKTVLRRPLPLTWSYPREGENADDDDDSSVVGSADGGEGSGRRAGRFLPGRHKLDQPQERAREKLWGEILERSFSTHNLGAEADGSDGGPACGGVSFEASLGSSSSSSVATVKVPPPCAKHNSARKSNGNVGGGKKLTANGPLEAGTQCQLIGALGRTKRSVTIAESEDDEDLTSSL